MKSFCCRTLENLLALPWGPGGGEGAERGELWVWRLLSSQADLHLALCRTISDNLQSLSLEPRTGGCPSNKKLVCEEDSSSVVLTQQTLSSAWSCKMDVFKALRKGGGPGNRLVVLSLKWSVWDAQPFSNPLGKQNPCFGALSLKPWGLPESIPSKREPRHLC